MSGADRLSYRDAVAALTQRGRFGISLGLERVERLMAEVDHPERGLRGALVGGTNGKGSVVAMTRSVLVAAGLRVGTMPKPHLVSYRERVAIDGDPISPDDFAAAVARVLPAIVGVDVEHAIVRTWMTGHGSPSMPSAQSISGPKRPARSWPSVPESRAPFPARPPRAASCTGWRRRSSVPRPATCRP